jgi:hypothetical protein
MYLKLVGTIAREKTTLSTDFRLFFLGLQRVSNRGHSPFLPGEISRLLPRKNGVNYSPRYINNQIRVLINGGLLSPASNSRCLVYPMELINLKTDKKQVAICPEHGTHSSWSIYNDDWVPDYPPVGVAKELIIPGIEPVEEIYDEYDEFYLRIEGTHGS